MAKSKVDGYGRVLIPKEVRNKLNLCEGDIVEISVKGQDLILRKSNVDLERRVQVWAEAVLRSAPKPFVAEVRVGDSKWLSRGYCLRKLGL